MFLPQTCLNLGPLEQVQSGKCRLGMDLKRYTCEFIEKGQFMSQMSQGLVNLVKSGKCKVTSDGSQMLLPQSLGPMEQVQSGKC